MPLPADAASALKNLMDESTTKNTKNEKTALFISPHLDDVIFSCGGTLAKMRGEGWRTILCTVFTKSVANPQGFALACHLDKNLAPEADYMKLRRSEDCRAAKILDVSEILHLNFPEAPHRGYHSAPELFDDLKPHDEIWKSVAEHFELLDDIHQPAVVFAPQGIGNHCDHRQTIDAALEVFAEEKIKWYYDTPYIIRQPDAKNYHRLPSNMRPLRVGITEFLNDKIEACAQYATQINFQFGGRAELFEMLGNFHLDAGSKNIFVEKFLSLSPDNQNLSAR